jgi:hypothetical protein
LHAEQQTKEEMRAHKLLAAELEELKHRYEELALSHREDKLAAARCCRADFNASANPASPPTPSLRIYAQKLQPN